MIDIVAPEAAEPIAATAGATVLTVSHFDVATREAHEAQWIERHIAAR